MSSQKDLEIGVDLESVQLVRMEDVQPLERGSDPLVEEEIETCIVDGDYEELLEDEDSNIGSMVSIRSEEVEVCESNTELIIPEVLEPSAGKTYQHTIKEECVSPTTSGPESWPTLEILPGGVINLADKKTLVKKIPIRNKVFSNEMMYACAKCSQSFKHLFSLVKHVRTHEDEPKQNDMEKITSIEENFVNLRRGRLELDRQHKKRKLEIFGKIADCIEDVDVDVFN